MNTLPPRKPEAPLVVEPQGVQSVEALRSGVDPETIKRADEMLAGITITSILQPDVAADGSRHIVITIPPTQGRESTVKKLTVDYRTACLYWFTNRDPNAEAAEPGAASAGARAVAEYSALRKELDWAYTQPEVAITGVESIRNAYEIIGTLKDMWRSLIGKSLVGGRTLGGDTLDSFITVSLKAQPKMYERLLALYKVDPTITIEEIIRADMAVNDKNRRPFGSSLDAAARRNVLEQYLLTAVNMHFEDDDTQAVFEKQLRVQLKKPTTEPKDIELELLCGLAPVYLPGVPRTGIVLKYLNNAQIPTKGDRNKRAAKYDAAMYGVLLRGLSGEVGDVIRNFLVEKSARGDEPSATSLAPRLNSYAVVAAGAAAAEAISKQGLQADVYSGDVPQESRKAENQYQAMEYILGAVIVDLANNGGTEEQIRTAEESLEIIGLLTMRRREFLAAKGAGRAAASSLTETDGTVPKLPPEARKHAPFRPGSGAIS